MQQVLNFKWNRLCDLQVLPSIHTEPDRWLSIGHRSGFVYRLVVSPLEEMNKLVVVRYDTLYV